MQDYNAYILRIYSIIICKIFAGQNQWVTSNSITAMNKVYKYIHVHKDINAEDVQSREASK